MRSQRGYTLIEALIVCVLLVFVLGGTLSLLEKTAEIAPQENERAHAVRDAQVQLAGMVRELRQAHRVFSISESRIDVRVPLVGGELRRVVYDCSAGGSKPGTSSCERTQYEPDGTTEEGTTTAIDRVINPDGDDGPEVFDWDIDADGDVVFVKARLEVPASGEREKGLRHRIVLDDGFFLRNIGNAP